MVLPWIFDIPGYRGAVRPIRDGMFNIIDVPFCSVQACADAYLTPCIKRYITGFMSGFKSGIEVIKNSLSTGTNLILLLKDQLCSIFPRNHE